MATKKRAWREMTGVELEKENSDVYTDLLGLALSRSLIQDEMQKLEEEEKENKKQTLALMQKHRVSKLSIYGIGDMKLCNVDAPDKPVLDTMKFKQELIRVGVPVESIVAAENMGTALVAMGVATMPVVEKAQARATTKKPVLPYTQWKRKETKT